jgi:hypothetical protein
LFISPSSCDVATIPRVGVRRYPDKPMSGHTAHGSIQTTGDIYTEWDIDQLAATMADVLAEDDETADSQSFPRPHHKTPHLQRKRGTSGEETAGIEPARFPA